MTVSSNGDDLAAVRVAEAERQRALVAADRGALDVLLSDDLQHVHSTSMVHGKAELIAHVENMGGFISIDRKDPQITLFGDCAIVSGPTVNTVRHRETGKEMSLKGFQTVVFRREGEEWRVLLSQLTPEKNHS